MGGLCSRSATVENVPSSGHSQINGHGINATGLFVDSQSLASKENSDSMPESVGGDLNKQLREPFSFPEQRSYSDGTNTNSLGLNMDEIDDGIPRLSRVLSNKSRSTKSKQVAVAKVSLSCLFTSAMFKYAMVFFSFVFEGGVQIINVLCAKR